ncbi:MAG TPA: HRDC domain-containing protein [Phycisphaerae bacterium]|nr:HRDC domain-containing protein [Phycisphaerae bacterium]
MKRNIKKPPTVTVTSDADLRSFCDRLADARSFAFDTEFIMEDGYETTVCLIQAATESQVALIDPLAGLDTKPFWELVADPSVQIVLHAAMEDLALCRQLIGKTPANVFDVQVAAGLVGRDYPLSLTRLVHKFLGIRLRKSQTLTDWRRRPLTDAQLAYAVDDVAYIPLVHQKLTKRLETLGRLDWASEEFAQFERPETYEPTAERRLLRLRGIGSLDPQGLAVAGQLLEVREALAKTFDRPARAVVRDHLLLEIARHRWTRAEQIRSLRGLNLRARAVEQLAQAVQRGLAIPANRLPAVQQTIEDTSHELVLLSLVTAVLRDFCLTHDVAFALMANKQSIRDLVHAHTRSLPTESALTRGWRARAGGDMLASVLKGQAAIRVVGLPNQPSLKVDPVPTDPQSST